MQNPMPTSPLSLSQIIKLAYRPYSCPVLPGSNKNRVIITLLLRPLNCFCPQSVGCISASPRSTHPHLLSSRGCRSWNHWYQPPFLRSAPADPGPRKKCSLLFFARRPHSRNRTSRKWCLRAGPSPLSVFRADWRNPKNKENKLPSATCFWACYTVCFGRIPFLRQLFAWASSRSSFCGAQTPAAWNLEFGMHSSSKHALIRTLQTSSPFHWNHPSRCSGTPAARICFWPAGPPHPFHIAGSGPRTGLRLPCGQVSSLSKPNCTFADLLCVLQELVPGQDGRRLVDLFNSGQVQQWLLNVPEFQSLVEIVVRIFWPLGVESFMAFIIFQSILLFFAPFQIFCDRPVGQVAHSEGCHPDARPL